MEFTEYLIQLRVILNELYRDDLSYEERHQQIDRAFEILDEAEAKARVLDNPPKSTNC